jgi:protein-tyrosine phosphatase/membrane-associated phospholipid phosphatase
MGHIHSVGSPSRWSLIAQAARTSVLLSLLFVIVYGSTNWLTAQRPDTHLSTWYFAWELWAIPYLPILIVPYMSLDLFFFGAPFLCRDKRELHVFSERVVFSTLVAAAFFLVFPLKLVWPQRPTMGGLFGEFVERSCTAPFLMEYPHNLFPALHITLCMIVGGVYGRHLRGIARVFSHTWFMLIALSTVLTWQHHLVDVAGGFVLGCFAFYLFRESDSRLPVVPNFKIGRCYAAGAVVLAALVPTTWPWGAFLLWPAAALGTAAGGYFGLGPGIYRKAGGRLPLSTRFVLAPVLIGQNLSLAHYRRQCRAWDDLVPGVWIGRVLNKTEAAAAVEQGVTAVLDLTTEFSEPAPFRAVNYFNLPILDLTTPTQEQLNRAVAFIVQHAAKGTVYVHCKAGYSRTAAVAGAYLLTSQRAATVEEAIMRVREVRPTIVVRPEAVEALRTFAQRQVDARTGHSDDLCIEAFQSMPTSRSF